MTKLFLFAAGCISLFAAFIGRQNISPIVLQDEKLSFTPHEFYIADVADDRSDRTAVASLIYKDATHAASLKQVDLQGGAAASIKKFVFHNLNRDTALRPVIVTIKQLDLTESASSNGQVSGKLTVVFSFELQLKYRTVHLTDYRGGIRYTRPGSRPDIAEPTLRHGIEDVLSYFNTWMDQNAGSNSVLAKEVKVKFTDYNEKPEGDTIYYAINRPLIWDDFGENLGPGRFEAEIFAGIGYTEQAEVAKGIIHINIALKVYAPKSDCLVKAGGVRDKYTLNHEQRHFDIEKLVGEHFKQKISAMHLPVDNFDGPINVEYLETLREANRLQKQYDAETRHGTDQQAQAQWNEKIDKELETYSIKK